MSSVALARLLEFGTALSFDSLLIGGTGELSWMPTMADVLSTFLM